MLTLTENAKCALTFLTYLFSARISIPWIDYVAWVQETVKEIFPLNVACECCFLLPRLVC
jgi:hypothetical protein